MDRDSVPAIIFIITMSLVGIIIWVLGGPSASGDECPLQVHPRHMIKPMHHSAPNDQHCVGR